VLLHKILQLGLFLLPIGLILGFGIRSMNRQHRKQQQTKKLYDLIDYVVEHHKPRLRDIATTAKAVRDDAGVIHSAPFADPAFADVSHAGIMLQAQNNGATFDNFVSEDDRGWVLEDGTYLRSGDVDEGPGAIDSTNS
jgi:hypothetical protein